MCTRTKDRGRLSFFSSTPGNVELSRGEKSVSQEGGFLTFFFFSSFFFVQRRRAEGSRLNRERLVPTPSNTDPPTATDIFLPR